MGRFTNELRSLRSGELGFAARAWALAPVVEASLAVVGLARTLRWVEKVTPPTPPPHGAPSLERARWLVDAVYKVHAVRGRCLPRALVQYALLRRAGAAPRFVVGVRKGEGLEAHAWVETGPRRDQHEPGYEPLLVTPQATA